MKNLRRRACRILPGESREAPPSADNSVSLIGMLSALVLLLVTSPGGLMLLAAAVIACLVAPVFAFFGGAFLVIITIVVLVCYKMFNDGAITRRQQHHYSQVIPALLFAIPCIIAIAYITYESGGLEASVIATPLAAAIILYVVFKRDPDIDEDERIVAERKESHARLFYGMSGPKAERRGLIKDTDYNY